MNITQEKRLKLINALPVMFSISILTIVVYVLVSKSISNNGGNFIYPLDDTYIHMTIAKNLAFNGTWGINQGQFNSASSSIIYSLMLASIFRLFGLHILIPLIINFLTALVLLWGVDRYAKKRGLNLASRVITLISMVVLIPLPTLVLSGMEHTLHCLFTFLFIASFSDIITHKNRNSSDIWILLILASFLVGIRYEGLFVVFVACVLLFLKKRFWLAIILGLFAFLPITIFGVVSIMKGSYFLPNSVLLKSQIPISLNNLGDYFNQILVKLSGVRDLSLAAANRVLIIVSFLIWLYFKKTRQRDELYYSLVLTFFIALIHILFAATGWLYRYESYLICTFVIFSLVAIFSLRLKTMMEGSAMMFWSLCFAIFLLVPVLLRSTASLSKATTATANIYQQQYQMAMFLKGYGQNETVAANDIGAISLFSNLDIVDLWGLGNIQVARNRRNGTNSPEFYDSLLMRENVKIAVLYDSWFNEDVYRQWKKVATWRILNNEVCGDDTVSFYVTEDRYYEDVISKLKLYEKNELPGEVEVVYY